MKYHMDFQFKDTGRTRPSDEGVIVDVSSDDDGVVVLPDVGDYVHVAPVDGRAGIRGRVATRASFYVRDNCSINIVVEPAPDDVWASLIKE